MYHKERITAADPEIPELTGKLAKYPAQKFCVKAAEA
jgi:hypothetical protein